MNIIKSDNGFPYTWKAGRVEHLIRNILERKAQEQLNVDRVMLVNPTWLLDRDLAQEIQDANPDFIICHIFVDPIIAKVKEIIQASGRPYLMIGNTNHCRLDFWAMVCELYFQTYGPKELQLNLTARKFMCLNRKPHAHRIFLLQYLNQVADQGYLTVGVDKSQTDADRGDYPIPNDIFTLGDLSAWQDSYLNIVTETVFATDNPTDFFISEKTWKPIIGGRPFFIYGQPGLRTYLKTQGFDVFDDLIDYKRLPPNATEQDYCELAVDTINQLRVNGYRQLDSRLTANQERFRDYVYEQWNRLLNLNLSDHI